MFVRGFRNLFEFPGYVVDEAMMDGEVVQVNLRRDRRFALWCPNCGDRMGQNRITRQVAWDLPLGTAVAVMLNYEAIQGRCRSCDCYVTVHPPGIDERARATDRLMFFCHQGATVQPLPEPGEPVDEAAAIPESTAGDE